MSVKEKLRIRCEDPSIWSVPQGPDALPRIQVSDRMLTEYQNEPQQVLRESSLTIPQRVHKKMHHLKKSKKKRPKISLDMDRISEDAFKKSQLNLKNILRKQKVRVLVNNFKNKLKRNLTHDRAPVQYSPYNFSHKKFEGFLSAQGISISNSLSLCLNTVFVMHFLMVFMWYGMAFFFAPEQEESWEFRIFQSANICLIILQIFVNSAIKRNVGDTRLKTIDQIASYYFRTTFFVDLGWLVIIVCDLASSWSGFRFVRLLAFAKGVQIVKKVDKIEHYMVTNFEKEQYWGIIKVFLLNFLMAHCIGILLMSITDVSGRDPNWMENLGIYDKDWSEKYAWAYFWAMSTMLGFGNATPANPKEAIFISIIQCFSCILLAYNINYVGTLITNISKQNEDKEKNLKISKRLAEENKISEELQTKMNNFIRQQDSILKRFNFASEREFISSLPNEIKGEFLKQSNKKIFRNFQFFKNLSEKILLNLAENIEFKIAHPQEIVFKNTECEDFWILKSGSVGFVSFNPGSKFNDIIIDKVELGKEDIPRLLNLPVLSNNQQHPSFILKSTDYSILYRLPLQKTIKILKNSNEDFEKFCELRDKSKHIIDEFELLKCQFCQTNHSKMRCPKLHYIPFRSFLITKYLHEFKKLKNERKNFIREKIIFMKKPLHRYKNIFIKIESLIYGKERNTLCLKKKPHYEKAVRIERKDLANKIYGNGNSTNKLTQKILDIELENELVSFEDDLKDLIRSVSDRQRSFQEQFSTEISRKFINTMTMPKLLFERSQFWDLEVDQLHDFRFYFINWNPNMLNSISLQSKDTELQKLDKTVYLKKSMSKIFKRVRMEEEVDSIEEN